MWVAVRSENLQSIYNSSSEEIENFRAALEWGLEHHIEENVRLAANFCWVSSLIGTPAEGVAFAGSALERAKTLPPANGDEHIYSQKLIARALFMRGMVGMSAGNMPLVLRDLKEAIALSRITGDRRILGYSLEMYYTASAFMKMPDREEAALEAFQIFSNEDDRFGQGLAYMNMARMAVERGDEDERDKYFGMLKEKVLEVPGTFQVGMMFLGMGMDESVRGHYAAARKNFEDGMVIFKGIGNLNFQLVLRSEIGHVERHTGNMELARSIYQETLPGWQEIGNRSAVAHQLECFGFLAIQEEEPGRAARLIGAAEALREKIVSPMTDFERIEYDQAVARLRAMLPEGEFQTLWSEGRSMTMEQAVQLALMGTG